LGGAVEVLHGDDPTGAGEGDYLRQDTLGTGHGDQDEARMDEIERGC
jgi:hypothetical protein